MDRSISTVSDGDSKRFQSSQDYFENSITAMEIFLQYLVNNNEMVTPLKSRLQLANIVAKFDHLLTVRAKTIEGRNRKEVKTNNRVQENMWYMAEDFICHVPEFLSSASLNCLLCEVYFSNDEEILRMHFDNPIHRRNFESCSDESIINPMFSKTALNKLLFENYIIFLNDVSMLYCKICCCKFISSLFSINKHLVSAEHIIHYRNIHLLRCYPENIITHVSTGVLNMSTANMKENLNNSENDHSATGFRNRTEVSKTQNGPPSLLFTCPQSAVEKHNNFIKSVFSNRRDTINIFCQICCYDSTGYDERIRLTNPVEHVSDEKHLYLSYQQKGLVLDEGIEWRACKTCRAYIFSSEIFWLYHSNNATHVKIGSNLNCVTRKMLQQDTRADVKLVEVSNSASSEDTNKGTNCEETATNGIEANTGKLGYAMDMLQRKLRSFYETSRDHNLYEVKQLAYYCDLCSFYSECSSLWKKHIFRDRLHYYNRYNYDVFLTDCDCRVCIISTKDFLIAHKKSQEHTNLARLFVNNLRTGRKILNAKNVELKQKFTCNSVLRYNNGIDTASVLDPGREGAYGYDTVTTEQSTVVNRTRTVACAPEPPGNISFIMKKKYIVSKRYEFGLKDLPLSTGINDIVKAFEGIGTIAHLYYMSPNSANIIIKITRFCRPLLGSTVVIKGCNVTVQKKLRHTRRFRLRNYLS